MDRKERLDHYHEKGQKDACDHNYQPPHSSVAEQLSGLFSSTESNTRDIEDKQAYDAGYKNSQDQRDDK